MVLGASKSAMGRDEIFSLTTFPVRSQLETVEQVRRFELLRLAFFVLKLRRLEQFSEEGIGKGEKEREFRCSLLRHVIFQQVVTLTRLDARVQAMQLIDTCRR